MPEAAQSPAETPRPLSARAAIVTGASSGLGAHFARLLAADGIGLLALAARRIDRLEAVADECRALGARRVMVVPLDVTDEAAIREAFGAVAREGGGLDLIVNNAGVADTAPALETTLSGFDKVMDVNLRGVWACAVEAARLMKGRGGDIVNIASILGLRVANNVAPYAVSKAGVVQMTKALALEWARHGIRVNALAPGYIETEINEDVFSSDAGAKLIARIPMRRIGRLADLDAPFRLLAHGASAYLTGAILAVDGGHSTNSL